jgi:hypothetical protein
VVDFPWYFKVFIVFLVLVCLGCLFFVSYNIYVQELNTPIVNMSFVNKTCEGFGLLGYGYERSFDDFSVRVFCELKQKIIYTE